MTLLFHERTYGLDCGIDDLRHADAPPLQRELVSRDAADVEQVVRQAGELLYLAVKYALEILQLRAVGRLEA